MKKLFASLFAGLLPAFAALATQAQTIRRVNNNNSSGITGTDICVDLTAAQTIASTGDIIQVELATTVYPDFNCTNQLTIAGPGYFSAENQPPALQASTTTVVTSTIAFSPGSVGSAVVDFIFECKVYNKF